MAPLGQPAAAIFIQTIVLEAAAILMQIIVLDAAALSMHVDCAG